MNRLPGQGLVRRYFRNKKREDDIAHAKGSSSLRMKFQEERKSRLKELQKTTPPKIEVLKNQLGFFFIANSNFTKESQKLSLFKTLAYADPEIGIYFLFVGIGSNGKVSPEGGHIPLIKDRIITSPCLLHPSNVNNEFILFKCVIKDGKHVAILPSNFGSINSKTFFIGNRDFGVFFGELKTDFFIAKPNRIDKNGKPFFLANPLEIENDKIILKMNDPFNFKTKINIVFRLTANVQDHNLFVAYPNELSDAGEPIVLIKIKGSDLYSATSLDDYEQAKTHSKRKRNKFVWLILVSISILLLMLIFKRSPRPKAQTVPEVKVRQDSTSTIRK